MIEAATARTGESRYAGGGVEHEYAKRWQETIQRVMSNLSPEAAEAIVTDFLQRRSGVDKRSITSARVTHPPSIDRKWFAFAAESLPAGPDACLHWCALVAARFTSTEWLGIPDSKSTTTYR